MRVFLWELKKIWSPWVVIATVVITILCYLVMVRPMFSLFNLDYPGWKKTEYETAKSWLDRYGPTLEENERLDAERDYELVLEEMEAFIASHPEFAKAGVYSLSDYQDYRAQAGTFENEEDRALFDQIGEILYFENETNLGFRYQDMPGIYWSYDNRNQPLEKNPEFPEGWYERQDALREADSLRSVIPLSVVSDIQSVMRYAVFLPMIAVFVLIAPYPVRDRSRELTALQWTSKTGRKVAQVQFWAALSSAFAVAAAVTVFLFLRLFAGSNTFLPFLDCPVNGFINNLYTFGGLTLRWWLISYVLLFLLFGVLSGALVFLISQYSKSYVPMLLKQLLLFVLIVLLAYYCGSGNLLDTPLVFYPIGSAGFRTGIAGIELWCSALLFLLAAGGCLIYAFSRRRKELL